MRKKLLSYNEISNNEKVVLFEIEIEEQTVSFFKSSLNIKKVKGYKRHDFCLCFYLDTGEIIHEIGDAIKAIIASGVKTFKI